jgi:hypothetical protein
MQRLLGLALLAALGIPAAAQGETFTDDFEGGANAAGWAFLGPGGDVLEGAGGNPDAWLHAPVYDTFAPSLTSAVGNGTPFEGDFRARGVMSIGFDLQIVGTDFPVSDFPVVLLLRNVRGTPGDVGDDDYAYYVGPAVPTVGGGWVHYDVAIPSQSNDAVPAGWLGGSVNDCASFEPGVTWNDVITNVDRVEILFLDPCFFAIFQQWNVGADNVSITYTQPTSVEPTTWSGIKKLFR